MLTNALTEQKSGYLTWRTDGYYKFGQDHWRDVSIQAVFRYKGQSFGVIPRYLSDANCLFISIENREDEADGEEAKQKAVVQFKAYVDNKEILLAEHKGIDPLVLNALCTVTVQILRSNFQIAINGVTVINTEYGLFNAGNACLYGKTGTEVQSVKVSSAIPDGWTTNMETISGAYLNHNAFSNNDHYIELNNPTNKALWVEQVIEVVAGRDYAISFAFEGKGKVLLKEENGTSPQTKEGLLSSTQWTDQEIPIRTSAGCTRLKVIFETNNQQLKINHVQAEEGAFATNYMHNESVQEAAVRKASMVTYPAKDTINTNEGTLSFWFSPSIEYASYPTYESTLFEYGEGNQPFRIRLKNGRIILQYKAKTVNVAYSQYPISKEEWVHVAVSWDEVLAEVYVNKEKTEILTNALFEADAPLLRIGHSRIEPNNAFNGTIDDLIVYQKKIKEEDIRAIADTLTSIPDVADMRLRATFDYAIGNFKKSSIDIPMAPIYGSPIIVEKADGTVLRKVSFFHPLTGKYVTYNEEAVLYDGFSDFIQVSYDDLDTTNFKIKVTNETGDLLGDPYRVEGSRIFLTLTTEEKDRLKGKPLYAQYQLEDSYTVDFNIEAADSFRVNLGKHDGQALSVVYEGNRHSTEKLADMVELNPALNPYHDGFLYITNQLKPTSVFRTKASPSSLSADGYSESLLVIEPLDEDGNPVTNASLLVEAEQGFAAPNIDVGSIRLREIAGRYLYRYTAPRIEKASTIKEQIIDRIRIQDKKSGFGVQVNMTLVPIPADVFVVDPDAVALEEEKMAAAVLNHVMDYYKVPFEELSEEEAAFAKELDFNDDGIINLNEIVWLNDNLRTKELKTTYYRIKEKFIQLPINPKRGEQS